MTLFGCLLSSAGGDNFRGQHPGRYRGLHQGAWRRKKSGRLSAQRRIIKTAQLLLIAHICVICKSDWPKIQEILWNLDAYIRQKQVTQKQIIGVMIRRASTYMYVTVKLSKQAFWLWVQWRGFIRLTRPWKDQACMLRHLPDIGYNTHFAKCRRVELWQGFMKICCTFQLFNFTQKCILILHVAHRNCVTA